MAHLLNKPIVRLHVCGLIFTPKLIPTIAFLLILPILISLGFWQLQRAAFKQDIKVRFASGQAEKPLRSNEIIKPFANLEYRTIQITGHFDNRHQFLIDNRVHQHRVGYQVITPFIADGAPHKLFLINRGWVPQVNGRQTLPTLKPIYDSQTITGLIKLPSSKIFTLADHTNLTSWPILLQNFNISKISNALKKQIYPFMILMSPKNPSGFARKWNIKVIKPEKHTGYAIQWFALALTLVIIYLVVNTRRGTHEKQNGSKD